MKTEGAKDQKAHPQSFAGALWILLPVTLLREVDEKFNNFGRATLPFSIEEEHYIVINYEGIVIFIF